MFSPKNTVAPKRPSAASVMAVRGPRGPAVPAQQRDERHDLPPPSLPARITSVRVTMIIIDQKINDTRPYTLSVLIGTGSGWLRLKAVWMVVGLVPMSPNTTPSAPPKLQCKTGRSGLGSSRHRLRTPARDRHRSQSSLGRDRKLSCPGEGCTIQVKVAP